MNFIKESIDKMPPAPGRDRTGLTQALRELTEDEALFVPAYDGESLRTTRSRITSTIALVPPRGTFRTRQDKERNGIWVFQRVPG